MTKVELMNKIAELKEQKKMVAMNDEGVEKYESLSAEIRNAIATYNRTHKKVLKTT